MAFQKGTEAQRNGTEQKNVFLPLLYITHVMYLIGHDDKPEVQKVIRIREVHLTCFW